MEEKRQPAIGVVGSGTMGAGIAQVALLAGHLLMLYDITEEIVRRGQSTIAGHIRRLIEKNRLSQAQADEALARLIPTSNLADLAGCDLVIEAAPEKLELKQQIFRQLGMLCPQAILASNTSSLSIAAIAQAVPAPERVVGMHFFNPAPLMPLVEIIRGRDSSDHALAVVTELARAWGKTPVQVKDTPGFIVNRVARPFYLEAFRILGEGLADVPTIDRAMEAAGFKMGPFRLLDLIGIDVNYDVSQAVYQAFDRHPRFEPHPIQSAMVASGKLGRKTGEGFYTYQPDQAGREEAPGAPGPEAQAQIQQRIISCLANEAAYALGEEVATADDIDTAMKLGTNYPKGPLAWADELGLDTVQAALQTLQRQTRNFLRYFPAPRLTEAVNHDWLGQKSGRGFFEYGT